MRKIVAGIVSLLLMLSFGMTVCAAETITEQNDSREIDVQAKAVYINPEDVYDAPVSNGAASITTVNGAIIHVAANSAEELEGLTLKVIEVVSEAQEGYDWIAGIMNGLCDKFTVYDIYFIDEDGNRINVTGSVTVSITTPEGYNNVQVYHIKSATKADKVTSKQSGGNTVFTAKGFSYYVLADQGNDSSGTTETTKPDDTTKPGNTTKPDNSSSPQTGDTSNMALCMIILLVSGGLMVRLGVRRRQ